MKDEYQKQLCDDIRDIKESMSELVKVMKRREYREWGEMMARERRILEKEYDDLAWLSADYEKDYIEVDQLKERKRDQIEGTEHKQITYLQLARPKIYPEYNPEERDLPKNAIEFLYDLDNRKHQSDSFAIRMQVRRGKLHDMKKPKEE